MAEQVKATAAEPKAVKYRLKELPGGAVSVKHRILGDITNDKLQGLKGATFIKAIRNCEADKSVPGFFEKFIEEVK
jgi:hypothetical protein